MTPQILDPVFYIAYKEPLFSSKKGEAGFERKFQFLDANNTERINEKHEKIRKPKGPIKKERFENHYR